MEENYIKKGEKAIKMHLFGLLTQKNKTKPRPSQTYLAGEKMYLKRGGGELSKYTIYIPHILYEQEKKYPEA